jgi:hypothetical protein
MALCVMVHPLVTRDGMTMADHTIEGRPPRLPGKSRHRKHVLWIGPVCVAVLVLTLLNNMNYFSRPVTVLKPRPSGRHMSLPGGGVVPADAWPNACELLTKGEVRSMFSPPPGKVKTERDTFGALSRYGRSSTSPGRCRYQTRVRGNHRVPAYIAVQIEKIGPPSALALDMSNVRTHSSFVVTDDGARLGAQDCFTVDFTATVRCRQGRLEYLVYGSPNDAKVKGAGDGESAEETWIGRVLEPAAGLVASKIAVDPAA